MPCASIVGTQHMRYIRIAQYIARDLGLRRCLPEGRTGARVRAASAMASKGGAAEEAAGFVAAATQRLEDDENHAEVAGRAWGRHAL